MIRRLHEGLGISTEILAQEYPVELTTDQDYIDDYVFSSQVNVPNKGKYITISCNVDSFTSLIQSKIQKSMQKTIRLIMTGSEYSTIKSQSDIDTLMIDCNANQSYNKEIIQ